MYFSRKSKGFTLVEIMVVIAIIGILSGIVVAGLNNAKKSSRDARRVTDLKNIQLAAALYYNDNLHYPCTLTGTGTISNCAPDFSPTYMPVVPKDPLTNANYIYTSQTNDAGSTDNVNCNTRTVSYYHLGAILETTGQNTQDDDKTLAQQIGFACSASNSGARFDGNATNCNGAVAAATDLCYDVVSL